ncbi:hypothetical protein BCR39DRAFT_529476 [Naematelia encephala]|uniref:Uncharacterized protein n=1 Tax=Naematelia encephala TaxID=71784 RepID=A0A1Y2B692_9TREE|nr:hypothetical protein BCR39DRAFT_529476 [Naematelia encephala]
MSAVRQQLRRALSSTDAPGTLYRVDRRRQEDKEAFEKILGSDPWAVDGYGYPPPTRYSRASDVLDRLRLVGGDPQERRQAVLVICEYVANKRAKGMRTVEIAAKVDDMERACETGLSDIFEKARLKCRLPSPNPPHENIQSYSPTPASTPLERSWSDGVTAASIFRDAYLKQREMKARQPHSKVITWLAANE